MNKKLALAFFSAVLFVLPFSSMAINSIPQPGAGGVSINGAINGVFGIIWPLFGAVAVFMFIYAGLTFLTANGDPTKIAVARKALVWGMVGVALALLAEVIPFLISDWLL